MKETLKKIIPYPLQFYFQKRRPGKLHAKDRHDLVSLKVDESMSIEVYHKSPDVAKSGAQYDSRKASKAHGIGLIVNVLGEEILRFDCFQGIGHFHPTVIRFHPKARTFLRLPGQDLTEQIDRSIFEVSHNIDWYIQHHPLKKIRTIKLNKKQVRDIAEKARVKMLEYADASQQSVPE